MEIRLRRKGEVITVDGFPRDSLPKAIMPPEGLEGIDLTAYSVIYATFGQHGGDKARALHIRAPSAIVVYKYEWRSGWGEGVLLPEQFDPSRVRFYKSAAQVKAEAEEAKKKNAEALCEEVAKAIVGVRVHVAYNYGGVVVAPEQEVFAYDWAVCAKSLDEAKAKVEKMRPLWKEWNDRVLAIYARRGFQNPGNGNIQLVFRAPNPPYRPNERVGIGFYQKNDRGCYEKGWIVLEKKDGEWVETNDIIGAADDNF